VVEIGWEKERVEAAHELVGMLRKPYALRVSYTKLDTYRTCPRKFKYIYVDRQESIPSEKMLIGQVVHSTLETWVAEKGEDLGDLMDIYAGALVTWRKEGPISDEEEELARQMLIDYYDHLSAIDKTQVVAVEQPFELYIDNVCITGVIDRVEQDKSNVVTITDYKTGRSSMTQAQAKKSLQGAIYTMAAKDMWDPPSVIMEFSYPRLKKSVIHEFSPADLQDHRDAIKESATNMRLDHGLRPSGTPPICGNCSFKYDCGWGKRMNAIWQGILRKRGQK
jgi:DNA helicase-2/ATP-dependent DNA helicase PcrA